MWCWQKKDTGNAKRSIEKHIYSNNRNKIQVNLVKQKLVQWSIDYPSTTQAASHVILSRGSGELCLMLSLTCIYGGGRVHYVESTTIIDFLSALIQVTKVHYTLWIKTLHQASATFFKKGTIWRDMSHHQVGHTTKSKKWAIWGDMSHHQVGHTTKSKKWAIWRDMSHHQVGHTTKSKKWVIWGDIIFAPKDHMHKHLP